MPKILTCPDCLEAVTPTAEGKCPFCGNPVESRSLFATAFLRPPLRRRQRQAWLLLFALLLVSLAVWRLVFAG